MSGAKLLTSTDTTLNAAGATINGQVFLNDGFDSNGEIRLSDANIQGFLSMRGAKLTTTTGKH